MAHHAVADQDEVPRGRGRVLGGRVAPPARNGWRRSELGAPDKETVPCVFLKHERCAFPENVEVCSCSLWNARRSGNRLRAYGREISVEIAARKRGFPWGFLRRQKQRNTLTLGLRLVKSEIPLACLRLGWAERKAFDLYSASNSSRSSQSSSTTSNCPDATACHTRQALGIRMPPTIINQHWEASSCGTVEITLTRCRIWQLLANSFSQRTLPLSAARTKVLSDYKTETVINGLPVGQNCVGAGSPFLTNKNGKRRVHKRMVFSVHILRTK